MIRLSVCKITLKAGFSGCMTDQTNGQQWAICVWSVLVISQTAVKQITATLGVLLVCSLCIYWLFYVADLPTISFVFVDWGQCVQSVLTHADLFLAFLPLLV